MENLIYAFFALCATLALIFGVWAMQKEKPSNHPPYKPHHQKDKPMSVTHKKWNE
ncbi:hypothetical protein [Rhodoflexus caldus]|uniref:hypothetical protein n=1 Tax=Rhodoflexus caldus TaxID=2891236 RepID=UPI00202A1151|nr:hypothetical protein [Rhodoflexus caldus]